MCVPEAAGDVTLRLIEASNPGPFWLIAQHLTRTLSPPFMPSPLSLTCLPPRHAEQDIGSYALDADGLRRFGIETNGSPIPDDQVEEMKTFLDCDEQQNLNFKGFIQVRMRLAVRQAIKNGADVPRACRCTSCRRRTTSRRRGAT